MKILMLTGLAVILSSPGVFAESLPKQGGREQGEQGGGHQGSGGFWAKAEAIKRQERADMRALRDEFMAKRRAIHEKHQAELRELRVQAQGASASQQGQGGAQSGNQGRAQGGSSGGAKKRD